MIFGALLFTLFPNFTFALSDVANCDVIAEKMVTPIPGKRTQGMLGFCSSFATATVLDQNLCSAKKLEPEVCRDNFPHLSTLDIVAQGSDGFTEGKYASSILSSISGKKIALESCAPFEGLSAKEDFLENSDIRIRDSKAGIVRPPTKSESDYIVIKQLRKIWQKNEMIPIAERCGFANQVLGNIRSITNLRVDLQQVIQAVLQDSEKKFLAKIVIPPACHKSAVQLPTFNSESIEISEGELESEGFKKTVESRLVSEIDSNKSFVWNFLQIPGDMNSGHAVAILGHRTICCTGEDHSRNCRKQFLARDSDTVLASTPGDMWVDSEKVAESAIEMESAGARCTLHYTNGEQARCLNSFTFVTLPAGVRTRMQEQ